MSQRSLSGVAFAWLLAASPASAQTQLVSQSLAGGSAGAGLSHTPAITPDGRLVAFVSDASDLLPAGVDRNASPDIFVADLRRGAIERVSVDLAGGDPDATSYAPALSRDGRFVAFLSDASDLVPGDTNGATDVFVRDRRHGTTERVSVGPGGAQAALSSVELSLSGDGRLVAFMSASPDLVGGRLDDNGQPDIFVHDRLRHVTSLASAAPDGTAGNSDSRAPSLSLDGRSIAFESRATDLVGSDTLPFYDIFVRDLSTGAVQRASPAWNGGLANNHNHAPSLSGDGRFVAFITMASNVAPGDFNAQEDIAVRDLLAGTSVLASLDSAGGQSDDGSAYPRISPDGRFVAFASEASNLAPLGHTPAVKVNYLRDLRLGLTSVLGQTVDGLSLNGVSEGPVVSRGGRVAAFHSLATNLTLADDGNESWDVFAIEP